RLRLKALPTASLSRPDDRLENLHVLHGHLERVRRGRAGPDGPGEFVRLDAVLIARRNLDRLDTRSKDVTAVVHEQPARPIGWGVERDLDLEARLCPEHLH